MPDFSGASLKLKAEGEDKILATLGRIDKKAQESFDGFSRLSQATIDDAAARFDQLYGKQSRAARQTQQVVEDAAAKVNAATGGMSHSAALGLGEMARGFGRVAESGNLSAFAVREFTGSAFRLGNALGSAGLGAGVGLAAIAIGGLVEYMQSAQKKADDLAQHYQQALDRIAHASSLFQASQEQQFAYSGDPLSRLVPKGAKESDVDYIKRTEGQLGLAQQAMKINAQIDAIKNRPGLHYESDAKAIADLTDKLKEYNTAVGEEGMQMSVAFQRRQQLNVVEQAAAAIALQKKLDKLDERSVAEYSNEALAAIVRRIEATHQLVPALISEHDPLVALRNEQQLLRFELDQGNISVQRRIQLEGELARVTKEVDQTSQSSILVNGTRVGVNPKAALLPDDSGAVDAIKKSGEKMQREADRVGQMVGAALNTGLMTAFKTGSIGEGFKALTQSILQGLGEMLARVAENAIIACGFMKTIYTALASNPWVAAAAAVAMLAFAQSLGGSGGGGSSGGYGGSYGAGGGSVIDRGYINPGAPAGPVTSASSIVPRQAVNLYATIIGTRDPKAMREIQELVKHANARGSV